MGSTIGRPNAAEQAWIRRNVEMATALARKYGQDPPSTEVPSLAGLDAVWVAFSGTLRETGGDPNKVINMVGLAFGELLVRSAEVEWAVVSDEHGTDIAVHGQPGDVLVFPTNLVAKRWASNEGAFVEQLFHAIRADIEIAKTAAAR